MRTIQTSITKFDKNENHKENSRRRNRGNRHDITVIVQLQQPCRKQQGVDQSWAQVENQYQRRADLIPNPVSTVKGYSSHEEETLVKVTEARAKATSITLSADDLTEENLARYQEAQNELSGALKSLLAVTEAYPDLKANQNFPSISRRSSKERKTEFRLRECATQKPSATTTRPSRNFPP